MRSFSTIFLVFVAFPALTASTLEDVDVKTTIFNGPDNGHAITGYQKGILPTRFLKTRKTLHDEERNNPVTSTIESEKLSDWALTKLAEWKAFPSSDHVLSHVRVGDVENNHHMMRQHYFIEALEKKEMEPVIAYFSHDETELLNDLEKHYGLHVVARVLLAARNNKNEQVQKNAENLRSLIINHWVKTGVSYSEVLDLLRLEDRPLDFLNWKMLQEFIHRKTGKANNAAILIKTLVKAFKDDEHFVLHLNWAKREFAGKAEEEQLLELEEMYLQYVLDDDVSINGFIEKIGWSIRNELPVFFSTMKTVMKFSELRLQEGTLSDYGMLAVFLSEQHAQYRITDGYRHHLDTVERFEREFFQQLVSRSVTSEDFAKELQKLVGSSRPDLVQEIGNKYTDFWNKQLA